MSVLRTAVLRPSSWLVLIGCVGLAGLAPAAPASAADGHGKKLSAPLTQVVLGDVVEARYSPDGAWLVWRADRERDEVFELFAAPSDGSGVPVRLNAPPVEFGDVTHFAVDPTSTTVVYRADQDANDVFELFSVPIDGSAPAVRISGTLVPGGDVTDDFQIAPAGGRVVYVGDGSNDQRFLLWRAALDGSTPPGIINGVMAAGGDVTSFAISPDGTKVAYTADQVSSGQVAVVPITGGPVVNIVLAGSSVMSTLTIEPTGQRLLYRHGMGGSPSPGPLQLFSAPLDGSAAPVRLCANIPAQRQVTEYHVDAAGARVVYRADQDVDELYELFSAPVDGSAPSAQLSHELDPGQDVSPNFALSDDGALVAYRTEVFPGVAWVYELWSVPADGSDLATRLSGPPAAIGGPWTFRLSADGEQVVYETFDTVRRLFTTPSDGSSAPIALDSAFPCLEYALAGGEIVYSGGTCGLTTRLFRRALDGSGASTPLDIPSGALLAGGLLVAPGGAEAAFVKDQAVDGVNELFSVNLAGAPVDVQVSDPFPFNALAGSVASLGSAGTRATYVESGDLFSVPLARGPVTELSGATPGGVTVHEYAAATQRVVFLARGAFVVPRLYAAPVDGSAPALELSGTSALGRVVTGFRVAADGLGVAYRADDDTDNAFDLYRVQSDGSAAPVRVSGPMVANGDAEEFAFAAGGRLVYRADQDEDEKLELYSGDGTVPATKLNDALNASGDVRSFQVSPDGTRVVFLVFEDNDFELFSAPSDGSAAPTPLGDALVNGLAFDYRISPDGSTVVYSNAAGLFAVPTLGGATTQLTTFVTNLDKFDLLDLEFRADGTRVVYLVDQFEDERYELFSILVDGSSVRQRLNPDLTSGGDVMSFALSADGARVVYRARQDDGAVEELYAVASDASAAAYKLNAPLDGVARDVTGFGISPDGQWVVYRADQNLNDTFELLLAPADGSHPATRISPTPATNGDVQTDFGFSADSRWALFRVDAAQAGALELFGSYLDDDLRPTPTPTRSGTRSL